MSVGELSFKDYKTNLSSTFKKLCESILRKFDDKSLKTQQKIFFSSPAQKPPSGVVFVLIVNLAVSRSAVHGRDGWCATNRGND
jgi:hypothetical protein